MPASNPGEATFAPADGCGVRVRLQLTQPRVPHTPLPSPHSSPEATPTGEPAPRRRILLRRLGKDLRRTFCSPPHSLPDPRAMREKHKTNGAAFDLPRGRRPQPRQNSSHHEQKRPVNITSTPRHERGTEGKYHAGDARKGLVMEQDEEQEAAEQGFQRTGLTVDKKADVTDEASCIRNAADASVACSATTHGVGSRPPMRSVSPGNLHVDMQPLCLSGGCQGTWDSRLLEFYRLLLGDSAGDALCHHTFRTGLQTLFQSIEEDLFGTLHPRIVSHARTSAKRRAFGQCRSPFALADALLAAFANPEKYEAVQQLLAEHLAIQYRHCTPSRVRWYAGRAGLHNLLWRLDQEVLLERAHRILHRFQGPSHRLRQALKVHRRREELSLNADLVHAAPHWVDLPVMSDVRPAGVIRRSAHHLFRCGNTVFRPRTLASHFPAAWGGCDATPPDLRADAVVFSLVELVFPSPAELVQQAQLSALAGAKAINLRSLPNHMLNNMLHTLALDNATAETMCRYLSTTAIEQPPGFKDVFFLSHHRMLVDDGDDVLNSDEEGGEMAPPPKRQRCY